MKTLLASLLLYAAAGSALAQNTPAGLWKTIDDETKVEKSLVRIIEAGGVLIGKVEKILSDKADAKCTECTDARKDQPVQGMTILRNIHGYACWLIDSRIPLRGATFPFETPSHHKVYAHLFPGVVQFGRGHAGFSFDAEYLEMPVRRDESALQDMLQRALLLTVFQYRRDRLLVQRVRSLLRTHPSTLGNADSVARALHMSIRTLHRHLRDEGSSLQGLRDEVRREESMRQLRRSTRPIKQVASSVGFRDEKSFSRAFKQWTGKSPTAFRRG